MLPISALGSRTEPARASGPIRSVCQLHAEVFFDPDESTSRAASVFSTSSDLKCSQNGILYEVPVKVTFRSDDFIAFPVNSKFTLTILDLFVDTHHRLFDRFETEALSDGQSNELTSSSRSPSNRVARVRRHLVARGNQLSFRLTVSGIFGPRTSGILDASGELTLMPFNGSPEAISPEVPFDFTRMIYDAMINEGL